MARSFMLSTLALAVAGVCLPAQTHAADGASTSSAGPPGAAPGGPAAQSTDQAAASTAQAACRTPDCARAQQAQEAEDQARGISDAGGAQIVVTGSGLERPPAAVAYSTSEIDRKTIISAPSGRIEDVLGNIAGFQQFRRSDSRSSNPSAQGVTLRALGGNATSRALVVLDGVPLANPFFGFIPLSAIAPERLAAIRVTRGGGAGPFGAGALAGTIEMQSALGDLSTPQWAGLLANDRGATEASLGLSRRLGAGFVSIDGRWDRGQGFFTAPPDQRVPASARARFDSWSINLAGLAPLTDEIELQSRVLIFRDSRRLRFKGADSRSEGQDASLRLIGRGAWQFEALAYVQARNFNNVVISSSRFTRVLDQRNTPSSGLGGKFELRPPVGADHVLRLGVDYRRSDGDLAEDAYSAFSGALRERRAAGGTNSDLGLFAEHDWALGALVLSSGLRADRTVISKGFYRVADPNGATIRDDRFDRRADWSLSWRAGAAVEASRDLRLRAAAYTGFRLPTLNELYRPFVIFPVVTQANPALRNERLEGFEAGFDWSPQDRLAIALTAFDNRVKNAIANVTIGANLRQRRNLPAIRARGIEALLSWSGRRLDLDANLAYTRARIKGRGDSAALDGFRPPQTPRFSANLGLRYRALDHVELTAQLRHVSAQFEDDRESLRLPAATTLGASVRYEFAPRWSLLVRAENLFDERVVTRNAGGALDLGAPRTLWAGMRYGF